MRLLILIIFSTCFYGSIDKINAAPSCSGNCCPYSCSCGEYCTTTCYHGSMGCNTGSASVTISELPTSSAVSPGRASKSPDGCSDDNPKDLVKLPFVWDGTTYRKLPANVNYKTHDCVCSASC